MGRTVDHAPGTPLARDFRRCRPARPCGFCTLMRRVLSSHPELFELVIESDQALTRTLSTLSGLFYDAPTA
jgi:hypothetical protein